MRDGFIDDEKAYGILSFIALFPYVDTPTPYRATFSTFHITGYGVSSSPRTLERNATGRRNGPVFTYGTTSK